MLKKKYLTKLFIICIFINTLLTGCKSASSLLHKMVEPQSYSIELSDTVQSCQLDKSMQVISDIEIDSLRNSELGLLNYFKDEHKKSNSHLSEAIQSYRQNEEKAIFDLTSFLKREYRLEGYDKVFLHNYKAINYLLLGEREATRVESKNSNMIQSLERKKLNKFKSDNAKKGSNEVLLTRYEKLFMNVNPTHNPYQNPFAYYISALSYAEDEDYDNAIIDIRQALIFLPHNKILEKKLLTYQNRENIKSQELFFDVGQSPLKSQVSLKVDMGNNTQRVISLPSFRLEISDVETIELVDSKGKTVASSSLLVDINAIKINEFKEKLPAVLSLITQETSISLATGTLNKDSKMMASLFKITSAIYTQNNRRTWSLLPQKTLVMSFIPQKNESYIMQLISKDGKVLERKKLSLNTYKRYQHFTIKNQKFCIDREKK